MAIACVSALVAGGCGGVGASGGGSNADGGSASGGQSNDGGDAAEQARMSHALVDSIGIQVHLGNPGNYTDLRSTWINRIQTAGIRHMRDVIFSGTSPIAQNVMSTILANTGVQTKFLVTQDASCSDATVDSPTNLLTWGWTANQIDGFEGMNEIGPGQGFCGNHANPTWYQLFANDASFLHNTVAGMPAGFSSLPVLSASLNEYGRYNTTDLNNDANLIGNITGNITHGNWHVYCSHDAPSCTFDVFPSAFTAAFGNLPYMVTETGYTTPPNGGDVQNVTQAGKYYTRMFFEWFNHGATRVYAYELLDDTSATGGEAGFGILYADASPKPAYTAISNIISILNDPGPSFTPGNLNYTLSGGDSYLHHTLLQKRNGVYYLVLWLEHNYYDSFSPQSITVNFPTTMTRVDLYDPLTSAASQQSWNSVNSVNITVSDQAVILASAP